MPRSNAGTYTLPAGTPYVSGTVASSTIVNSVNSDVGTELTNSLDRNGRGQMLAPLALTDGSVTAPGLTFNSEPASGLFRAGTNDLRLTVGGNAVLQATAAGAFTLLGITSTSTVTNASAFVGTGNGTGPGALLTGGAGGAPGVSGTGTVASPGVAGVGGPSNGPGLQGTGTGTGQGVIGTGGSGGGVGITAIPGTTGLVALDSQGNITLSGAALANAPNVSVSGPSTLTYATAVRCAGSINNSVHAVGAQTLLSSYNVASATLQAGGQIVAVTFANYTAASATSWWFTGTPLAFDPIVGNVGLVQVKTKTNTGFTFQIINLSGTVYTLSSGAINFTIDFEVKGF